MSMQQYLAKPSFVQLFVLTTFTNFGYQVTFKLSIIINVRYGNGRFSIYN